MKLSNAPLALLEPSHRAQELRKQGVNVGSALTQAQLERVPVPVVNVSDQEYLIRKGTTLAVMRPTTDVLAWGDTTQTAQVRATRLDDKGEVSPEVSTRRRTKVEDVPEHVRQLLSGISPEITLQQQEELAAALTDYQDVFSKGPNDMGCTGLAKHQIYTGDARPIRQPPSRLPIAKQGIEQEEVRKMLEKGVIEPRRASYQERRHHQVLRGL